MIRFGSTKYEVELTVPIQVRYELGLVPSYFADRNLPSYDPGLPGYEEHTRPADMQEENVDLADDPIDDHMELRRVVPVFRRHSEAESPTEEIAVSLENLTVDEYEQRTRQAGRNAD